MSAHSRCRPDVESLLGPDFLDAPRFGQHNDYGDYDIHNHTGDCDFEIGDAFSVAPVDGCAIPLMPQPTYLGHDPATQYQTNIDKQRVMSTQPDMVQFMNANYSNIDSSVAGASINMHHTLAWLGSEVLLDRPNALTARYDATEPIPENCAADSAMFPLEGEERTCLSAAYSSSWSVGDGQLETAGSLEERGSFGLATADSSSWDVVHGRSGAPRGPEELACSHSSAESGTLHGALAADSPGPSSDTAAPEFRAMRCPYPSCSSPTLFTRWCDMNKHQKCHDRKYPCRIEGCRRGPDGTPKSFATEKDRNRHELIHDSSSLVLQCPYCIKSFNRRDNMRNHWRQQHKIMC